MSRSDRWGAKVEPDPGPSGELLAELGSMDPAGIRRFVITLFRGCGVPWSTVAEAFRCSEGQAKRDGRLPGD